MEEQPPPKRKRTAANKVCRPSNKEFELQKTLAEKEERLAILEKEIADMKASNAKRNTDTDVSVFSGSSSSPVVQTPSSSSSSHGCAVVCSRCHHHSGGSLSSSGSGSGSGGAAARYQRMMSWAEQISVQDALAAKTKELIIARAAIAGDDVLL